MRADTRLPPYLPYPRFLLQADLTQTAKLLYALLLDRATLSQSNGWLDESGRIYLVFPIEKIAAALDRSTMTVKTALSELEDAGLIERRRSGFSKPNRIYVKLPPEGQKSFQTTDRNLSSIEKEKCPTDGKKIVPMMERKLSCPACRETPTAARRIRCQAGKHSCIARMRRAPYSLYSCGSDSGCY